MKRKKVAQLLFAFFISICMVATGLVAVAGAATTAKPRPAGESSATSKTSPADRAATLAKQQQAQAKGTAQAQAVGPAVVTIGFDDGRQSQANAGAILASYGFAGTFYLISGGGGSTFGLDNPGFLTQDQARTLASEGHEIGGHTRSHPQLTTLNTADQTVEICGGRQDLIDDGLGTPVSFAYPYGSYDTSAMGVAQSCGFTSARSVDNGLDSIPPAVPMAVNALPSVSWNATVADLQSWVQNAENSSSQKWANLYWHDVVDAQHPGWGEDGLGDAAPGYEQSVADFQTFLGWLQGEVSAGRVVVQTAGAVMASAPPSPPIVPSGPIGALWTSKGGAGGFLGQPLDNEYDVTGVTGARMEDFVGGKIYWSLATGAHEVHGAILAEYLGAAGGPVTFGLPLTDETTTTDGIGRFNHFSLGGSIYWTPNTGAHEVSGVIKAKWAALGWEVGILGYPTSDELDGLAPGRYNNFQHGVIYWSPTTGAHEVHGVILTAWAGQGYEHGRLGFPTSDQFASAGGQRSNFQGGYITWTSKKGVVIH